MEKVSLLNRIVAITIAMSMLLGISITSFADESITLNEQISNATEESTITLEKDYIEDVIVPSGKNITLNLAGHTLKGTDASATPTIKVEKGATLVIKGDGTIINNSTGNGAACIFNNGTVTIDGATIKKETGNKSYYNIANHGKMIINSGTILNDTVYAEGQSHASLVENGYYDYTSTNSILGYVESENDEAPYLEINGGTFDGGLNTIKNDDGATLIINDAYVKNQIQVAIFNVSEATINGGKFDVPAGNDKTTIFNRRYNDDINKGKLTVNGGEFNADYFIEVINNATEAQMGEIKITGGIFNTKEGLVNTNGRVDITTIEISGGEFTNEPSDDKIANDVEKFEKASGEWVVGKKVVLTLKYENGTEDKVENHLSGDEITLVGAEKEGFEFEGWKKDDETLLNSGDTLKLDEDTILIAQWKEKDVEAPSGEQSGDVTEPISGEQSGDVTEPISGEQSGDETEPISGEDADKTSGENSSENGSANSGEKEDDKDNSGSHNGSGKTNTKTDDDKKEDEKKDETKVTEVFDDVKSGDWFKTYVDKASELELIKGVGNKKFAPNNEITRGMLVEILYRYAKAEEKTLPKFSDVSNDAYYAQAISWAANNKVVYGVGNNKFEPDRAITREELATILFRFTKIQKSELVKETDLKLEYIDQDEISDFALEAIKWCTESKIINGREEKKMAPKANTTRAEATTMIVRLVDLL